jgi:hypothetical protein
MGHAMKMTDNFHQTIVGTNGVGIATAVVHDIVHLYVTAKAYNLVADGVLESQNHAHRYYHNSKTDSHSYGSYTNSWTTHFSFVALITIYSFGYV